MGEARKGGDTVGGKKDGVGGRDPQAWRSGKKQTVTQGSLCREDESPQYLALKTRDQIS